MVIHNVQTSPLKPLGQSQEPQWEGGTKVYINGIGHMTKMVPGLSIAKTFKNPCPYMVKTFKKPSSLERWTDFKETTVVHQRLWPIKICINHGLGLILICFTAGSNLVTYAF